MVVCHELAISRKRGLVNELQFPGSKFDSYLPGELFSKKFVEGGRGLT